MQIHPLTVNEITGHETFAPSHKQAAGNISMTLSNPKDVCTVDHSKRRKRENWLLRPICLGRTACPKARDHQDRTARSLGLQPARIARVRLRQRLLAADDLLAFLWPIALFAHGELLPAVLRGVLALFEDERHAADVPRAALWLVWRLAWCLLVSR